MNNSIMAAQGGEPLCAATFLPRNLIDDFIQYLQVADTSRNTYLRCLRPFFDYINAEQIAAPTEETVIAYRQFLSLLKEDDGTAHYTAATKQLYIIAVKRFFQWTEKKGIYPNIAKDIKGFNVNKMHKKDSLTADQVRSVLNQFDNDDDILSIRNKAILTLMVSCGLRDIEIVRANVEDLRTINNHQVLYIRGKGREEKDEFVIVSSQAEAEIRNYFAARGNAQKGAPLFAAHGNRNQGGRMTTRSVSRIAKTAFRNAGLPEERITAHSLRHTAITLALVAGIPIDQVSQFARHSNINTTMIYNHAIERENNPSAAAVNDMLFREKD